MNINYFTKGDKKGFAGFSKHYRGAWQATVYRVAQSPDTTEVTYHQTLTLLNFSPYHTTFSLFAGACWTDKHF